MNFDKEIFINLVGPQVNDHLASCCSYTPKDQTRYEFSNKTHFIVIYCLSDTITYFGRNFGRAINYGRHHLTVCILYTTLVKILLFQGLKSVLFQKPQVWIKRFQSFTGTCGIPKYMHVYIYTLTHILFSS